MTDFVIPCDTFVRLASVLQDMNDECAAWFKAIRIEDRFAVASNRMIMAIENIEGGQGVVHVIADPALIEQCRIEAQFSSKLVITVNEVLQYAVAKTSLGYIHPGNCMVVSSAPNDLDRWRAIVASTKEPAPASKGGMFWFADDIARLAKSAPSGMVVFEEHVDCSGMRPTLIRDPGDYDWLGLFQPFTTRTNYSPATLPSWMLV